MFSRNKRKTIHVDDGFSLLELVIAVSIILIASITGTVAYQGITDNSKKAAVEKASNDTFTAALAADANPHGKTMQEIEDEYNESLNENIHVNVAREGKDISVVANGWNNRYTAKKSTKNEETNDPFIPDNENEDFDLSFLDNPNKLPMSVARTGVCTPEIELENIKKYVTEVEYRTRAFFEEINRINPSSHQDLVNYINENGTPEADNFAEWNSLWIPSFSPAFQDPDCGLISSESFFATSDYSQVKSSDLFMYFVPESFDKMYFPTSTLNLENPSTVHYLESYRELADEIGLQRIEF